MAASRKMLSRSAGYWRDPVTALRLPPVLLEQIDSRATERDISRSDAMRHLIELWVKRKPTMAPAMGQKKSRRGRGV